MRHLALALVLMSPCSKAGGAARSDAAAPDGASSATAGLVAPPPSAVAAKEARDPDDEGSGSMSAAELRALTDAETAYAELTPLIAKGVLADPKKPGDGDANDKCSRIEAARPRLAPRPEPEIKNLLELSQRACSFDVPLLQAKEALDQAQYSPSQASRLLACNLASREIAEARAVKADDRRVRELEGRRARTCH